MSTTTQSYRAKDITVLEGLEPVRKRPAMFIGGVDSRGVHHLLWEILDNAIDEVINGHASTIEVELDANATVDDLLGAALRAHFAGDADFEDFCEEAAQHR